MLATSFIPTSHSRRGNVMTCHFNNVSDVFQTNRYGMETSYTAVKELTQIAGIIPFKRDVTSEFLSSPHTCSFTLSLAHCSNHPLVAASLGDFHKLLEKTVSGADVQWKGLERQLTISESANSLQVGHVEKTHWSYVILRNSDIPAQVKQLQSHLYRNY